MSLIIAIIALLFVFVLPLMTYAKSKTGVKTRRYNLYIRQQAAYTQPTDAAGVTTLLGTATEIGEVENQNKKIDFEPSNQLTLDDGNLHSTEYKGIVEIKHVNNTLANITALNTDFNNQDCDLIMHDTVNDELIVVKDITLHIKETYNSGDVSILMITGEKLVPNKAALIDQFAEPVS